MSDSRLILHMFVQGSFDEIYSTTIGLCIETQEIQNGEERFKVNYWDTGGDYLFPCRLPVFIRKCDAVIVGKNLQNKTGVKFQSVLLDWGKR